MDSSISIIVPLYNEGSGPVDLVAHLDGVAPECEVIVVDASDNPESRKVANTLDEQANSARVEVIKAARSGRALQMNLGAEHARGDVLLFLHCDTRLNESSLKQVSQVVGDGARWGRFDIVLDAPGIPYRVIETMIKLRSRVRQLATGDQGIFVTAELFHKVGGYPEIALMEDVALSKSLAACGPPVIIPHPIFTSARRWQNRGPLRTIFLMWKLRFLYWIGVPAERLNVMYGDER